MMTLLRFYRILASPRALIKGLYRQRSGATAIEYGLVGALVSIAIVGGAVALSNGVEGLFDYAGTEVTNNMPGAPAP